MLHQKIEIPISRKIVRNHQDFDSFVTPLVSQEIGRVMAQGKSPRKFSVELLDEGKDDCIVSISYVVH